MHGERSSPCDSSHSTGLTCTSPCNSKKNNNFDEINNFFMNNYWKQNWDLREAHEKSLSEMEELKRFQGSTFETIARRKLIEDRDTVLELTAKIQEFQNEINCMNDLKDFKERGGVQGRGGGDGGGRFHLYRWRTTKTADFSHSTNQSLCWWMYLDQRGELAHPQMLEQRRGQT